ncbi:S8 family peptidase [Clostridium sp. UBA1652]|uniref:S8 family peptidase n=1 Tax=Clostridium sp. UBA1652 TaxID=1946348 RepID=UPI002580A823|nr:S8 family peptidase [Clostridium sp. UBA1652]
MKFYKSNSNDLEVFIIETNKFDSGLNLLNNVPGQLIYKVVALSENEKINQGNVEVIVLFGDNLEQIVSSTAKIGGVFENLGFGFGIVTVKASDIRRLSELEGVQYVELPKVLFTSDYYSNRACCVLSAWESYGLSGEGVIVGFIDTGIDYTHPAFRDENGNTRIDYIYDLGEDRRVYNSSQINEAIRAQNPYSVVNVRDPLNHGTHVAGIACAGGRVPRINYGVAYKSSIIMVKTARGGLLNYALSTQIMRGIKFIVDRAKELNRPSVINISLSTNDGAHNGTSLLEQYIETICKLERVAIVVAAGNEGDAAHHTQGLLENTNNIILSISEAETSVSLQLYKPLLSELSIQITNPLGERTGNIVLNEGYKEMSIGKDRCIIYNTGPKPFDINGEIIVSIVPSADYVPSGQWSINLQLLNEYRGVYNIWLPISEALNTKTKFLNPSVYNTLGIPATVQSVISVGSYNYLTNSISPFSGRGKIEVGSFNKPDLVAPGDEILSTVSGGSFETKSGTSMAAPHVAGICALLLEWGIVRGNDPFLFGDRLKYYLSKGSKRERKEIVYPDPSWGYGTICTYDSLRLLGASRGRENLNEMSRQNIEYALVEYQGDIVGEANKLNGVNVQIIDNERALIQTTVMSIDDAIASLRNRITYVSPGAIYTLCDISPLQASGAIMFQDTNAQNNFLSLSGSQVVVGIIDTGIDYLNEEFINEAGNTRIISIFDQTEEGGRKIVGHPIGSEFIRADINKAIEEMKQDRDPYAVVPSRDTIGHGTSMAGIVGARGVNPDIIGVAPKCEFAIVKLKEGSQGLRDYYGVYGNRPVFYSIDIILAINYLYELSLNIAKPMIILLPLGSTMGAHNGFSSTERYIDRISKSREITFVVPTGNEGEAFTHTSGVIRNQGGIDNIELQVDKNQKDIRLEIWVSKPDKFALSVVSPSGEIVERVPPKLNEATQINFIYEKTQMSITYFIPEEKTGDEKIVILARNIREGIWIFRLIGDFVSTGQYNAWLLQKELLAPRTMFIKPNHYTTLTLPSTSLEAISVSYYDQNYDTIVESSGRGFSSDGRIKPDLAAGGINALTTGLEGTNVLVSGSSVAAAIIAGCAALIMEWGIVKGNDTGMYATKMKTYLVRGTDKRPGDVYPNPEWGYGTIDMKKVFDNIRSLENKSYREISPKPSENKFLEEKGRNYLVEYNGDIVEAVKRFPNTYAYVIDDTRAIIAIEESFVKAIDIISSIPEVIVIDSGAVFTLCDISPIEASGANLFYNNIYLPLDGRGVTVGIIDTGIDYLNKEFMNDDGTSRILSIWDQTIESNQETTGLIQGTIYSQEQINRAINESANGRDPYAIVPSKDELGHGTNMAGIIAAKGTTPVFRGVAPKCDLAIVKLKEASNIVKDYYGIYGNAPVFRSTTLFMAIRHLYELSLSLNRPMVIFLPLGTNNGPHNGDGFTDRYIDEISSYNGITVVVPSGNQGNTNTHTSGLIKGVGDVGIIELRVGRNQSNIRFEIWISKPDKVSISITSPSGEVIQRVPPKLKGFTEVNFVYEETNMIVEYSIPEEITGDQRITIVCRKMKPGIWKFQLTGELIVVGRYDSWILQKELLAEDTRFLNPDPQITLTAPSTSSGAISVAFYNQNNNSIVPESGRGYTRKNLIKPDIAAGGINQITTDVNEGTKLVSGSSVAGAVLAGCCALIMEWGIVDQNDITLYATKVKTYLIRGTSKRPGDIYPNPEWGYGMLNMKGVFDNIRGLVYENRELVNIQNINYFNQDTHRGVLIEYQGDIRSAMAKYPNTGLYILDNRRAAIAIPIENSDAFIKSIPQIIYNDPVEAYTLSDISPVEASQAPSFINSSNFALDGTGVVIGLVDTGIDYLNEQFINEDGTSKILTIWDQAIVPSIINPELVGGVEYSKEEIDRAIQLKASGGDPYSIVPSKDEVGHGTHMASILIGRGTIPELQGVSPGSNIAVVKPRMSSKKGREFIGIYGDVPSYRGTGVFFAVRYLYELALKLNRPMVIYVPLGTNTGAHNGTTFLERYIDEISNRKGIVVVVPTGNQGNTDTHTSGMIEFVGDSKTIELKIGPRQKDIRFEIWVTKPDKVSLSIISPTGEIIKKIVPKFKEDADINFVYEKTRMYISFLIPEEITGDQKIVIFAENIKEGIWQFILIGELITVGRYDSWLLQRELIAPGTAFLNPTSNTTLTIPSTSERAISVGYYNQNNNSIVPTSGKGYTRNNIVKPDIAAGGVNQIVTSVGGGTQVVSGSSVAGAITAGCSALVLQWGIVNNNDPNMYASKVKTYLIRGTNKRPGDIYPNPNWGYGMLDFRMAFEAIRSSPEEEILEGNSREYYLKNLFIRLPKERDSM